MGYPGGPAPNRNAPAGDSLEKFRRIAEIPPGPIRTDHTTVEIRGHGGPGGRLVLMDGVEASHVDMEHPERLEFEYLRHVAALVDATFPPPRPLDAFLVGGGPCALARRLAVTHPSGRTRVVERDGALVEAARRWLGLRPGPRLEVVVGDGRDDLAGRPDRSAGLVMVDAFQGRVVPPHLVTVEFARDAARVLGDGGLHVVNAIDVPPLPYAAAIAATLAAVYPSVVVMADERVLAHRSAGNVVVAASPEPLPVERLRRLTAREPCPWAVLAGRRAAAFAARAEPLRDDTPPDALAVALGALAGRDERASGYSTPTPRSPRRRA